MAYKDPTDQHRDSALAQHQVFRYRKPENITAKKATVQLCQSDRMRGRV